MSYELNTGMKVFSQLYVGYKNQEIEQDDDYEGPPVLGTPLGFATPYEDNAAGKKRQTTVDGWALQYGKKEPDHPAKIIDNTLAEGFKITDDIKRVYYGGGNVVFRVEDPRGFELEIQAQNLMTLIRLVGVDAGGVIPGKCCWGRDGAHNILIHESSDEFKNARLAAENLKPMKGIKAAFRRGDMLILTNANKVRYLGRFWFSGYQDFYLDEDFGRKYRYVGGLPNLVDVCFSGPFRFPAVPGGKLPTKRVMHDLVEPKQFYAVEGENGDIIIYRELKAAAIVEPVKEELTVEEALHRINKKRYTEKAGSGDPVTWISAAEHQRRPTWEKRPMTQQELDQMLARFEKRVMYDNSLSLYDYVPTHEGGLPISYVLERGGEMWDLPYTEHHDRYVISEDHILPRLVRIDRNFLLVDRANTSLAYDRNGFLSRSMDLGNIKGLPVEIPIVQKPKSKEDIKVSLTKFFEREQLFVIVPTYGE